MNRFSVYLVCVFWCLSFFWLSAQSSGIEAITPENVGRLQEIARYGNGIFTGELAYSPDGNTLAVAGSIGVWFYNAHNLTLSPTLLDLDQWVDEIDYSPDGRYLAYGIRDSAEVIVIDVASGEEQLRVQGAATFAFHPDGERIAVAIRVDPGGLGGYSARPEIPIYDLASGSIVQVFDFDFWIKSRGYANDLAFSMDGLYLAVSVADFAFDTCNNVNRSLFIWRMDDDPNQIPVTIPSADRIQFTPDSSRILTVDGTFFPLDTIYVHDLETQTTRPAFSTEEQTVITDFAISTDGNSLITIDWQKIRIWDVENETIRATFEMQDRDLNHIALTSDENQFIAVHPTYLQMWHISDGPMQKITLEDSLYDVILHPSGNLILNVIDDANIEIWAFVGGGDLSTRTLHLPSQMSWEQGISENGQVALFVDRDQLFVWNLEANTNTHMQVDYDPDELWQLSPDGSIILQQTSAGMINLWSTSTGAQMSTLVGDFTEDVTVALSPDSSVVAINQTVYEDESTRTIQLSLWDVTSGELVWEPGTFDALSDTRPYHANLPVFSEDNTRFAVYSLVSATQGEDNNVLAEGVRIFDLQSHEMIFVSDRNGFLSPNFDFFVFYPERSLGSVSPPPAGILNVSTGEILSVRGGIEEFSAQDTYFVSRWYSVTLCGGDQRIVTLHDSLSETMPFDVYLPPREAGIGDVADFNSDGRLMAVTEASLRIYDTDSQEELYQLYFTHDRQAGFNATDTLLVTIGKDGAIRVYGVQ